MYLINIYGYDFIALNIMYLLLETNKIHINTNLEITLSSPRFETTLYNIDTTQNNTNISPVRKLSLYKIRIHFSLKIRGNFQ